MERDIGKKISVLYPEAPASEKRILLNRLRNWRSAVLYQGAAGLEGLWNWRSVIL